MGLFSWASHALHSVTHGVSSGFDDVTHVASDAWSGIEDGAGDLGHFFATRWKTIAAVAAGTLVFVAVAAFAPELLPGLIALAPGIAPWVLLGVAGAASGAVTRTTEDLLSHRTPGWDVLKTAAITGAITVATAGTLRFVAPQLGEALPFLKPLTARLSVAGQAVGDGAGKVEPWIGIEPFPETPAESSITMPFVKLTVPQALARAPKGNLILGLISGDAASSANKKLQEMRQQDLQEDGTSGGGPPPTSPGFVKVFSRAQK